MLELLEELLLNLIEWSIVFFELVGVIIIICTGIRGLYDLIKKNRRTSYMLLHGLSLGLTFLLGGEILKTITIKSWQDVQLVLGIIVMRVTLAILSHWEMKKEKEEEGE